MKFCPNCGKELEAGVKFCPSCGKTVEVTEETKDAATTVVKPVDDVNDNKGIACLSYLGILALIPFFAKKDSPYAQYHALQGLNLCIIWFGYCIIYAILTSLIKVNVSYGSYWGIDLGTYKVTPWWVTTPLGLIGAGIGVFALIGFIWALQGKKKELPLFGKIKIVEKFLPKKI